MKKILLLIIFITVTFSLLADDIYPKPDNISVSEGLQDSVIVNWSSPVVPSFGEGFEGGIIPPNDEWDTLTTNHEATWQIMDNSEYVEGGEFSACVPFTYSDGEVIGLQENIVKNGSFNSWSDGIPDLWSLTDNLIVHDTISITDSILAISSAEEMNYVYQNISVEHYSKYKLEFSSKQDSLISNSKYGIKILDNNNSLLDNTNLTNYQDSTYQFDFYTSSTDSIQLRLYPSNQGDSIITYWDNISLKKYNIEPNQDEWLITEEYEVQSENTQLKFDLGTSKFYGIRSPVYILLSTDDGNNWIDTLTICDGSQNSEEDWNSSNYETTIDDQYVNDTITIAFRYLGGNGELVCLDNVRITENSSKDYIPVAFRTYDFKNKNISRAPVAKMNKAVQLDGYELFRRSFVNGAGYSVLDSIPSPDTTFIDTSAEENMAYLYKVRAIYNGYIRTKFTKADTGWVYDDIPPGKPKYLNFKNYDSGSFKLVWSKPDSIITDLIYYKFYDNGNLLDSTDAYKYIDTENNEISGDITNFTIDDIQTKVYNINMRSEDFEGNLSEPTTTQIPIPPNIEVDSLDTNPPNYAPLKITISKWQDSEICSPSDSIRIYRSTSTDDSTFYLYKTLTDPIYFEEGKAIYTDSLVSTDSTYYYYSTLTYNEDNNYIESLPSEKVDKTPTSDIKNISNLYLDITTDTSATFHWSEPNATPLNFGGVYIYRMNSRVDTIFRGDTTYTYITNQPEIVDFKFKPFDKYGHEVEDLPDENVITNVIINLEPVAQENFNDGNLPWNTIGTANNWQVSEDGSSQWFYIPEGDSSYAYVNDDIVGQNGETNCKLIIPNISSLSDSTVIYLFFDTYFQNDYNATADIMYKDNEDWTHLKYFLQSVQDQSQTKWIRNQKINLSNLDVDTLQLSFNYNDNGNWTQGLAIDNIKLYSSSSKIQTLIGQNANQYSQSHSIRCYPNPFNSTMTNSNISFYIDKQSTVSLSVYNILGQLVKKVKTNKEFNPGFIDITWNGKNEKGSRASSGIYFYKLNINDTKRFKKFIIMQ